MGMRKEEPGRISQWGFEHPQDDLAKAATQVRPPPASSEVRDPPGPGCSLPRNSVYVLFWSVGDLFTWRSRLLLPTNFILQK